MPTPAQKTTLLKPGQVQRNCYLVDAADQVLGRLAARIARVLMGKHKPEYTPHVDGGDTVIVVNCEKIRLTGRKADQKTYDHYSGYPGGHKIVAYRDLLAKHPERVIKLAVRRMLPKNRLAGRMLKRLRVYAGEQHPHAAQKPAPLPA
jgi:large subunit ribosomal protein L13